jgi:mannose-6-phosphate isomerase-like protein (cupin superfamily)
MLKEIIHNNKLLGIIISHNYSESGIHFCTPDSFSQQLAFMKHPAGKTIKPHVHNPVQREVHYTKEVLFIRKGKVRIDFYTDHQQYIESYILETGDVILLSEGGHGFEILEETEMIEVKQGPYAGEKDKTRFDAVEEKFIKYIKD